MRLLDTLRFITTHPMTRDRPLAAIGRFLKWQLQCRLYDEVIHPWIAGSKLAVRKGMTGATGNIYCGLHEYVDMSFVLHLLRPGDLFVDAGANVGSYTVLAAAVAGAEVVAIEPDPDTVRCLRRNIEINNIGHMVEVHECALGANVGSVAFTVGLDTMNKVALPQSVNTREVRVDTLDRILAGRKPVLIKMDVEGFESEVLKGARHALGEETLLAIETEDASPATQALITSRGFSAWHYDPLLCSLVNNATDRASNALFIRSTEKVMQRLNLRASA